MRVYSYILLIITIILTPTAYSEINFPDKTTFMGIEVIGANHPASDEIKRLSPIKIGDFITYSDKQNACDFLRNIIKEKNLVIGEPTCSAVLYKKNKINTVYLIIEIDLEDKQKKWFRNNLEKDDVSLRLPVELRDLYDKLEARSVSLIQTQEHTSEHYTNGFLDYDDPILHDLAVQLSKRALKHHQYLLEIIHKAKDAEERQKASKLLSWAGHNEKTLELALQWDLFFDADPGVRNSLTRSIGLFLKNINDVVMLEHALSYYCKLIELPSFTDRNKSLGGIQDILRKNPELSTAIGQSCKQTITEISEFSVLENVGGYARDILKLISDRQNV